jgi:amino acid transporter
MLFFFVLGDILGLGELSRAVEIKEGSAPALAILSGAALAFYALIGFEDSVNIAEETTRPERAYPVPCLQLSSASFSSSCLRTASQTASDSAL